MTPLIPSSLPFLAIKKINEAVKMRTKRERGNLLSCFPAFLLSCFQACENLLRSQPRSPQANWTLQLVRHSRDRKVAAQRDGALTVFRTCGVVSRRIVGRSGAQGHAEAGTKQGQLGTRARC